MLDIDEIYKDFLIVGQYNKAAKAVSDFLTAQGPDACEDKPNEYFAVMDKAFGRTPTEEEVWKIEELGYQLRKKDLEAKIKQLKGERHED